MPEHTPAPTPHRAIYGFACYLLSHTLFIIYLMWALLPTKQWGFSYLPDKYFAILLPMVVLVAISFFLFFIYPAINMSMTPDIDEISSVMDSQLILKAPMKSWKQLQEKLLSAKLATDSINKCKNKFIENCTYCNKCHHLAQGVERVDTLYFLDSCEINKNLFS